MARQVMSKQAIFNKVARHLLKQGRKAGDRNWAGEFKCRYRAGDGARCAVGCLIPDEVYDSEIEGLAASDVMSQRDEVARACGVDGNDNDTLAMLDNLQSIHDDQKPSRWAVRLREEAKYRGLKLPRELRP